MGLEHIHSHGIIHGDLHLQNILIGNDGMLKIADFGKAKKATSLFQRNSDCMYFKWY